MTFKGENMLSSIFTITLLIFYCFSYIATPCILLVGFYWAAANFIAIIDNWINTFIKEGE